MKLKKVIDYPSLQCYIIDKFDKKLNKKYPKNNIIIRFRPLISLVSTINTDDLPGYEIFNDMIYMFCKRSTKYNEKSLKKIYENILGKNTSNNLVKYCGLNSCEQSLFTKDNNVILQIFSLENREYPITYFKESINVITNYNEISKTSNDKLKSAINKIVKDNSIDVSDFETFVKLLNDNFPLNYGGSLRRFENEIEFNEKSTTRKQKEYDFYIGYDLRFSNSQKENELVNRFEDISYKDKNKIVICETYNNKISDIKKQCKNKKIKYTELNKYAIKIDNKDFDKLKLVSTISDFI